MSVPPDELAGKTRGILGRLPHFFDPDPEAPGDLLRRFVDVFGRALEGAEGDLYRVMRAHHVETADNESTRGGLIAPAGRRGDLDAILALYLESLGGTSQLVKVSPAFTRRSLDTRLLARLLAEDGGAVATALREGFRPGTRALLDAFREESARFRADEVGPAFLAGLFAREDSAASEEARARARLAGHLLERLRPATRALLDAYDGGEPDPSLAGRVARDLNDRVLPDVSLYRRHRALWESLPLPESAAGLRAGIYRAWLLERAAAAPEDARLAALAAEAAGAEPVPTPPGDDLRRLNRELLEAAFPWVEDGATGFRPRGIPTVARVRDALVEELNAVLEAPAWFRAGRFPALEPTLERLRARYPGEPRWVARLALEEAFPRAIEHAYVPYRERLLGLIGVLRRGASTRRGIVDIVAANLGIVGADAAARRAREAIEVVEYNPVERVFFRGGATFQQVFEVSNDNPSTARPRVRLLMLEAPFAELANPRLVEMGPGGRSVTFPGRLRAGDRLQMEGGRVLLNGIVPQVELLGTVPELPTGPSRWRFEADVVVPGAEAPQALDVPPGRYDRAVGGRAGEVGFGVFTLDQPVVEVEVTSYRHTPGVFTVRIPWDLPGFTDKFDPEEHPRTQIRALVDRVKAAGVEARVAYWVRFAEEHALSDALGFGVRGPLLSETQDASDALDVRSRQSAREDQEMGDALVLEGAFERTRFDSLNTFA